MMKNSLRGKYVCICYSNNNNNNNSLRVDFCITKTCSN